MNVTDDNLARAVSHHASGASEIDSDGRWAVVETVAGHPDLVEWMHYFLQHNLPSDTEAQYAIALLVAQAMLRQHEYTPLGAGNARGGHVKGTRHNGA